MRRSWIKHIPPVWRLAVFSFVIFLGAGILLITNIPNALEGFLVNQVALDTSIKANFRANRALLPDDLTLPADTKSSAQLKQFFDELQIPSLIGAALFDANGEVIYYIGRVPDLAAAANSRDFIHSLTGNVQIAAIRDIEETYQEELGIEDALTIFIPISLGFSKSPSAILYAVSDTTFIKEAIVDTQNKLIFQFSISLALVYITITTILFKQYHRDLIDAVHQRTKDLEASTKRELEKAREVAKLKDEFVFIAAHELRHPTFVIRGNIELLERDVSIAKLSPGARESLRDIEDAGERLQSLVNDLLETARLEYGRVQFHIQPVELWPIIKKTVGGISLFAREREITVSADETSFKDLPKALVDPARLEEILMNLLTNAVKYNKPRGTVSVSGEYAPSHIVIHVHDTGVGLTPEEQSHLFTKFWRASSQEEGTGLGLWITKHLVENMRGEIHVESKKDEGSTFSVKLEAVI